MSQNFSDPYQPPTMQVGAAPASADVELFRNIAFWQRFFSILGFVVTGLVVLVMVVQVALAAMSGRGAAALIGALFGVTVGLAISILVYFLPALFLGNAAKATKDFGEGRISQQEYLIQQKKFWRYTGITISIIMVIYLVFLAGLFLIGLTAFTLR